MSIFVSPDKFINITLYYIEEKTKNGSSMFDFITSKDEMEEWKLKGYKTRTELSQEKSSSSLIIESLNTVWKKLNWKEQNELFSQCLRVNALGESEIDTLKYRELKLKKCLIRWDAKDDNGNPVELSTDSLDILSPDFAIELLKEFESITETK